MICEYFALNDRFTANFSIYCKRNFSFFLLNCLLCVELWFHLWTLRFCINAGINNAIGVDVAEIS